MNIITPRMAYIPMVAAWARRYRSDVGIGGLINMALHYSIGLLINRLNFMLACLAMGIPAGPGAPISLPNAH